MKIFGRLSLLRKLIWYCDVIGCITIFSKGKKNFEKEEEEDRASRAGEDARGKKQNKFEKEEDEVEDRTEGGAGEEAGGKKQNKSVKEENEEHHTGRVGGGKKKSNSGKEDEEEDHTGGATTGEEAGGKRQNKSDNEEGEEKDHTGGGGAGEEAGGRKQNMSEKEEDEEDHVGGGAPGEEARGKKQNTSVKEEEENHAVIVATGQEAGGKKQNKSEREDDHAKRGAGGKKQNMFEKEENEEDHVGGARGEGAGGKKQNKSEKEEGEEEDHAGGGGEARGKHMRFQELPDDIMQLIFNRLSLLDYLNCREVSLCWQAAVDSKRWLPAAHQLPWLLHPCDLSCTYQTCHIKTENGYCFASGRELRKSKYYRSFWVCCGTVEGWLILVNFPVGYTEEQPVDFLFLNPVSGARVILPSHSFPASKCFPSVKIAASSVPTTKRSCWVTSLDFEEVGRLAFCTPTDKSWTFIEDEKALRFWDIDIVDGKLYAVGMDHDEFLVVFDIHLDPHDSRLHTYTLERRVTVPHYAMCFAYRHLAVCSESMDIFIILHQRGHKIFKVLKLEYNVSTSSPQWVDTVELGDRALFIGAVNNIFIACGDKTPERNCIYFAVDSSGKENTSGVFSLTDRTIKPLPFPKNHLNEYHDHTFWFTPNPW